MTAVEVGRLIGGRYKILRELGRGGMGVVYLVEHAHTGEKLALKVLIAHAVADEDAVARFKREARASARIQSEHVVRVTDADIAPELDGAPFMVMEFLDGLDLERLLARDGPMPPAMLVRILGEVGRALGKAHRLGIVHRDLKPENLFLHRREDGVLIAKILDFGISKILAASDVGLETAGMTATGSVLGTPLFMAPEQAHGDNEKIGPSTDIWALGLVAMRLLTAEYYWPAKNMAELMLHIIVKPIGPPSERWPGSPLMTPELDAWFLRSCHREQAARFATVEEQVVALSTALGVALPSSPPQSTSTPPLEKPASYPAPAPHASASARGDSNLSSTAPLIASGGGAGRVLAPLPTPSAMAASVAMGTALLAPPTPAVAHPVVGSQSQEQVGALARSMGSTRPAPSRSRLLLVVFGALALAIAITGQQLALRSSSHAAPSDAGLATSLAFSSTPAPAASDASTPVTAAGSAVQPAAGAGTSVTAIASAVHKPLVHQPTSSVPSAQAGSMHATPITTIAPPATASAGIYNPQAP